MHMITTIFIYTNSAISYLDAYEFRSFLLKRINVARINLAVTDNKDIYIQDYIGTWT